MGTLPDSASFGQDVDGHALEEVVISYPAPATGFGCARPAEAISASCGRSLYFCLMRAATLFKRKWAEDFAGRRMFVSRLEADLPEVEGG